ncbi:MAG TPA: MG2 domain-containing protein [Anaerolineae bacterium]|nr:MG2 domain-containing protein [Anaerolineae bacterium]
MVRASTAVLRALSAVTRANVAMPRARSLIALLAVLTCFAGAAAVRSTRAQTSPIRQVTPADNAVNVWNGHRVIVDFARDMDQASAEASLAITPTVRGHMEWPLGDRRHMEFVPHDIYRGQQTYAVTLAAGRLRDAEGRPVLDNTYRWHFTARQPDAQPRFGSGLPLQQLTLSGGQGIPFDPGYPRARFDVRLFAINGAQFAERYAALARGSAPDPQALDPGELRPDHAWTAEVDASSQADRLDLPDSLKAGLYLVEVAHPVLPTVRELLVYSDHALAAKTGRRGLLVWATRQPEGSLAPDARFSAYDADGRRTQVFSADAQGLARLPDRGDAVLLVAMVQGQPAVVGLDGWWPSRGYATGQRQPLAPARDVVAHLHTDRPIYRPGHTVHWKAVLQQVQELGLQPLGANETVTLTLRDAVGNVVQELARQPDAFGSIAGDLLLSEGAGLGVWRLQAQARGQLLSGSFIVQDYLKPDFKIDVATDRPYYIEGQKAQITVRADYYFGQPVVGGEVVVRVFDNGWTTRSSPLAEVKGLLDAAGQFQTEAALTLRPPSGGRPSTSRYTIEVEVTDASRRPVYATVDRPVHPAAISLSAAVNGYSQPVGKPVAVSAVVRDHDGHPVAGRAVEVTASRSDMHGSGGIVARAAAVTDADGLAEARLSGLDLGWYTLSATALDDQGRVARSDTYVWVYSLTRPWRWSGGLAIEADSQSYKPGDTARLLVKSPITTTALITLEGPEVLAERVVAVAGATTVELPITAAMAPGVTARVTLWEPVRHDSMGGYDNAADGRLLSAQLELRVPAEDRRLQVMVLPDRRQARPGEALKLRLTVRDAAGRPVRAQLSVALVDQALLALARDGAGDIFEGLWGFRRGQVSGHDSWSPSSWWWSNEHDPSQRYLPRPTSAPGSSTATAASAPTAAPSPTLNSSGGPDAPAEEQGAQPRRDLPDTAYWNAAIVTDVQGEAEVTVTLPDSLTTWQALARAVDLEGRAGQGTAEVVVSKPVSVEAALPRFLVQGDRLAVDLLGRNDASVDPLEGFCRLDSPGLIQLDPGERRLQLEPGAMTVARWSAVASDVGLHRLTATLRTPMGDDAVEQPLRVEPFTVPEPFGRSGVVTRAPVTETLDLPLGVHPLQSVVEVSLSPSLASAILGGLDSLIGYPYGCVEQTMSRMLPNGVVGRLILEMDLDAPQLQAALPPMMAAGLQKLYGYQAADGSWGWWNGGGNTYITAYVLHGLTLAKASGYAVDDGVLDRGFRALGRLIAAEADLGVQAFAHFVMAEAGRVDVAAVLSLNERRERLDAFALGALAVALRSAGRQDLADQGLDLLRSRAIRDAGGVHWASATGSGAAGGRSMASSVKTTSMALLVLARMRPEDPLAPEAVRWLMAQRQGLAWGQSTHDTAWAVLGLTDWIVASNELTAAYDWRLNLDGKEIAAGRHEPGLVALPIVVRLPGADLTPGRHLLVLSKGAGGSLYYSLSGRLYVFHPDFKAVAAAGSGLSLGREYMAIDGRPGPERWQPGDLINVRLTLQSSQELSFLMLQDWLPAGFEAVNTALDTETKRLPNGQLPWWRWWGYERRELRDEGATFFISRLPAGRNTFEYAVRAVTPGRFGVRPAEAYAMYQPQLWARSDSRRVDIALNKVADLPPLAGDIDGDCRLTGFDADLVASGWAGPDAARDLDGSGTVDALDIAVADAHRGLSCGEAVPAAPAAGGEARLDVTAERADDGTLTITVRTGQDLSLDSWELTIDLPTSGSKLIASAAVRPMAAARALGPVLDAKGRRLRLGGFLPGGAALAADTVLARVRLQSPGHATSTSLVAVGALAAAADGRALAVTVGGDAISRSWREGRVWLPWIVRP